MDFISDIFDRHAGALMDKLGKAGFSEEQVGFFLPEAASGIYKSTHYSGIARSINDLLSDPSQFLSSVNVTSIAQKLEMNTRQVKTGLALVIPVITQALSPKNDEPSAEFDSHNFVPMMNIFGSAKRFISLRNQGTSE